MGGMTRLGRYRARGVLSGARVVARGSAGRFVWLVGWVGRCRINFTPGVYYIYILFCYSAPGCILAFCIENAPTLVTTRSCPVAIGAHSGCNLFMSSCN
jgi:hypothetical protein